MNIIYTHVKLAIEPFFISIRFHILSAWLNSAEIAEYDDGHCPTNIINSAVSFPFSLHNISFLVQVWSMDNIFAYETVNMYKFTVMWICNNQIFTQFMDIFFISYNLRKWIDQVYIMIYLRATLSLKTRDILSLVLTWHSYRPSSFSRTGLTSNRHLQNILHKFIYFWTIYVNGVSMIKFNC